MYVLSRATIILYPSDSKPILVSFAYPVSNYSDLVETIDASNRLVSHPRPLVGQLFSPRFSTEEIQQKVGYRSSVTVPNDNASFNKSSGMVWGKDREKPPSFDT